MKKAFEILKNYQLSDEIQDTFPKNIGEKSGEKINVKGRGIYEHDDFSGTGTNYRYYLEIDIPEVSSDKTLTAIMLNPSKTYPNKKNGFDSTVRNVIRIAQKCNYSKLVILNISAVINPKGNDFLNKFNPESPEEKLNQEFIKRYLQICCSDLLIAWGNKENRNIKQLKKQYINIIFDCHDIHCKAYDWNTKENCPYHPSQQTDNLKLTSYQSKDKKEHIIRYFLKNRNELLPLEIKNCKLELKQK